MPSCFLGMADGPRQGTALGAGPPGDAQLVRGHQGGFTTNQGGPGPVWQFTEGLPIPATMTLCIWPPVRV